MATSEKIIEHSGFVNHTDITRLVHDFEQRAKEMHFNYSLTKKIIVIIIEILENSFHYTRI